MKPAIETQQLGKKFKLVKNESYKVLRDVLTSSVKSYLTGKKESKEDFWALQNIELSIAPGERLGIIGRNGAGKSTLLKILSGITPPSTGEATIRGRFGSLLEVGTGFHPELTGRENIYFNGSVLGLKKAEITRRFDEIVDFSGVEDFLDLPLKKYSSGMELRLAFAVAAHLETEVLIIDEVLAVGDAAFQKKCLEKMDEVSRESGKTILFVSHNLAAVKNLCTTAVLLDKGKIINSGSPDNVVNEYLAYSFPAAGSSYEYLPSAVTPGKDVFFRKISFSDAAGNNKTVFGLEEIIFIQLELENRLQHNAFSVGIAINDVTDRRIVTDSFNANNLPLQPVIKLQVTLPQHLLTPGNFTADLAIERKGMGVTDFIKHAVRFEVIRHGTRYEFLNYDYGVINATFDWKAG